MSSILAASARKISIASSQAWASFHKSSISKALRSTTWLHRIALGATCAICAIVATTFAVPFTVQEQSCPALTVRSAVWQPPSPFLPIGPARFFKQARQAQGFELGQPWNSEAARLLTQCVQWKPVLDDILPPLVEERAQLLCHSALLSPSWFGESWSNDADPVLAIPAERRAERFGPILGSVKGILRQCKAIHSEFREMRGHTRSGALAGQHPDGKLASFVAKTTAFDRLADLEVPAREALQTIQRITVELQRAVAGDKQMKEEVEKITTMRIALRACLVDTVREARSKANVLPSSSKQSSSCKLRPAKLSSVEIFAVTEAYAESDADVVFGGGLLLSQAGMSPKSTGMFDDSLNDIDLGTTVATEPSKSSDDGAPVPRALLLAEAFLQRGFEAAASLGETEVSKKASSRAGVLAHHAKFLMELGDGWESPAELRYREAATIARQHGRDKLASHALAQLAYFLSLRSRSEDALMAAEEAVGFDAGDPLAIHLRAVLQLSTGSIRTHDSALAAKKELEAIKGRLPNARLEAERADAHAVLAKWLPVARSEAYSICLTLGDIAEILTCVAAKLAYA
eukprot:TRINITY_DN5175_c0_g2_i1.p1 TRINITY_DN5175_c0_g2~~TRINITY_DN5175_c0_g2_i1.p1  ORF type:complete len:575 (-),score=91.69 TRINITY_DN5175_c0_g2_i1:88-1812(-)